MILSSPTLDQSTLATMLAIDPVVKEYRALFSLFDWSIVEQWEAQQSDRGRPGHPISAYLKAFLLRVHQKLIYTSELRHFLVTHPLLILELGFRLEHDPSADYGFDIEKTLPCRFWLGQKLRNLDQDLLQQLLHATVVALQAEIPGLGETVAFDVKHIYAWVKENNERAYVPERYDKTKRPVGDPDCRLGVKKSSNQEKAAATSDQPASAQTEPPASAPPKPAKAKTEPSKPTKTKTEPKQEKKELIWGYGSGVAAATTADYGDVVLGEHTLPFHENDVTYFRPLHQRSVLALGGFPTNLTADAAFDAWYVYQAAALHGGIAAVPLNQHGHPRFKRDSDGVPLCPRELRMHPMYLFNHPNGYHAQLYRCPLYFPEREAQATCDHPQFQAAKGCVKHINVELGGLMRVNLDRESPLYHAIYTQRTSCERINSQAKELGIERPKVRNIHSVRNLNTLTYLIINVRALDRAKTINRGLLQIH